MNQREVTDDNTTWTCVQAYGSLSKESADLAAEKSGDGNGNVTVVCTPSGGAQTVRLQLGKDWLENLSDADLVSRISAGRN